MTCLDKDKKEFFRDKEHEPLVFKFRLIHEGFANTINRQLREEDMTFSQMMVVSYLWENRDKKIAQKDISEALHIKHPTTIGLLKRLEDKEMVKVVVNPDNRKYRNIAITSKGEDFIVRGEERRKKLGQNLVDGFDEKEVQLLRDYLDRVIDNMHKYE